jgi:hypothetical protein
MTFGMISIAETTTDIITLDTPIQELNNLTLNEVFRDNNQIINGDFSDGNTNWSPFNAGLVAQNNTLTIIGQGNHPLSYAQQNNVSAGLNHYIYIYAKMMVTNSNAISISISSYSKLIKTISNPIQNQWYDISELIQAGSTATLRLRHSYVDSSSSLNQELKVQNVISINLTSLSIDHLTKTQLDEYFDIYINGGYYEYDSLLNDLDMTDFIIISSSFVLWLWFMRFVKGVL